MNIYQLQYIMNDEQQKFIIKRRISQMEIVVRQVSKMAEALENNKLRKSLATSR